MFSRFVFQEGYIICKYACVNLPLLTEFMKFKLVTFSLALYNCVTKSLCYFVCKVRLIQVMKQQCIQLHPPTTNSSSSNRSRRRQRLLLLLPQLPGQGPPSRKKHHSKISNWNQNSLPNRPRFTIAMFARSAVLAHRYLLTLYVLPQVFSGYFLTVKYGW